MPKTPSKKDLGQYFTISETLQKAVFDLVRNKGCLLEPSFGAGHLLTPFLQSVPDYPMVCYELDATVSPVVRFSDAQTVVYGDFLTQTLSEKFPTIVGNPPYVKQRTGNLYLNFIERCVSLLTDTGELVFIVPSDFLKLTRAALLIEDMQKVGRFTDFHFPHDERLFEGATIDVVVFRFQKGAQNNSVKVNGEDKRCVITKGIVTFRDIGTSIEHRTVANLFDCYVGLVSGRDKIFKVPFANMAILSDKERVETFIFADTFPTEREDINAHLLEHKVELMNRKIRRFSEDNWYEWGAPRNIQHMRRHAGKPCIYVRTLTRKKDVAFAGIVQFFGGGLLCLVPKEDMSVESLQSVMEFLNSEAFQKDYLYAGRFKMGHKQLCNALLPD